MGKNIKDSWICNDCMAKGIVGSTSTIEDDSNNRVHHEHIGLASESDVSPNTPTAEKLTNE